MRFVSINKKDGVVVLTPKKDLVGGDETDQLLEVINQLDEEGSMCLIVNLSKVGLMSSMGLDTLIVGRRKFLQRDAKMKLCNLKERHVQLLAVIHLAQWFDIYDNEDQAVTSCAS